MYTKFPFRATVLMVYLSFLQHLVEHRTVSLKTLQNVLEKKRSFLNIFSFDAIFFSNPSNLGGLQLGG